MYEYSALNATLATTNYRVGNIFQAISAARLATARTGMVLEQYEPGGPLPKVRERDFLLQKKVIEPYLRLRFVLDTAKGAYVDALHAGADAQALGLLPPDDPMLKQFEAVVMKVQHADALRADAEIGPDQEWKHEPLFRNFTLRDLKGGTLERIRIECRGDGVDQPYVPGAEIHLPTDANTCTLTFKGSPGTTFQIAEYRSPLRE